MVCLSVCLSVGLSVCRPVCLLVGAAPGGTDTQQGNINHDVTRRRVGGAQIAEGETRIETFSSQQVHWCLVPNSKRTMMKNFPEVHLSS